ncbi:hypothetical protein QQF64_033814 [Cirrhinus molitorella]|uniref:Integrase catalytic domain-containing protein n=1 Tax=Cirrhinus molitorella TaxID=172907 RepID=A0ABR3MUW9_9TELE
MWLNVQNRAGSTVPKPSQIRQPLLGQSWLTSGLPLPTHSRVAEPWEIVGMDLSKRAEEVTQCVIKLFYKFGAPKRILTDQGTEFVNQINLEVCQTLGISRSLCAPYHPQTNGLVEKLNGTIQRTLSKLVERKPSLWADYLEATMFGLRTKKQLTTKFSPYFLLFGREARYPCEVPDKYEINESVEDLMAGWRQSIAAKHKESAAKGRQA